ncbi:integrase catalytic domain-containing protein [Trichonephila clavipes]|nr:integrase catalytic domain-containing protein [Trichonephila clavipes]
MRRNSINVASGHHLELQDRRDYTPADRAARTCWLGSPGSCTSWRPETQNSAFLLYPLHSRFLQDPTSLVQREKEKITRAPQERETRTHLKKVSPLRGRFSISSTKKIRQELKDDELKKIIECFENNEKSVNFANWLERGYLMNQGTLFRYSPTSESEEAQLVVPIHERQDILKIHHDAPNAGHYGADGTFERISKRYYWTVQNQHDEWEDKLASIRFALNSAKCDTTGKTAAYLQFGREMRTIDDVTNDFRAIIDNENFVPEITLYLKRLARISSEVRERIEEKQDQRKTFYDKRHRPRPLYHPGDKVWVTLHPLSNAAHKKTAKFMPKRDGPYTLLDNC